MTLAVKEEKYETAVRNVLQILPYFGLSRVW